MALIQWKQIDATTVTWATVDRSNKQMAASTTTADGQVACATTVAQTPATSSTNGGWIEVLVNGVAYPVGDGVKTTACYFSGDGGSTARTMKAVVSGDTLYWNGSHAGFQLSAATDLVDFIYAVAS